MGKRKKKKKMLVELMPESNGHTGTPSQEHNCLSHFEKKSNKSTNMAGANSHYKEPNLPI